MPFTSLPAEIHLKISLISHVDYKGLISPPRTSTYFKNLALRYAVFSALLDHEYIHYPEFIASDRSYIHIHNHRQWARDAAYRYSSRRHHHRHEAQEKSMFHSYHGVRNDCIPVHRIQVSSSPTEKVSEKRRADHQGSKSHIRSPTTSISKLSNVLQDLQYYFASMIQVRARHHPIQQGHRSHHPSLLMTSRP